MFYFSFTLLLIHCFSMTKCMKNGAKIIHFCYKNKHLLSESAKIFVLLTQLCNSLGLAHRIRRTDQKRQAFCWLSNRIARIARAMFSPQGACSHNKQRAASSCKWIIRFQYLVFSK